MLTKAPQYGVEAHNVHYDVFDLDTQNPITTLPHSGIPALVRGPPDPSPFAQVSSQGEGSLRSLLILWVIMMI